MSASAQGAAAPSKAVADNAPYPAKGDAWFVVICLMLAYAVALVDRQILALLVQPLRADLKLCDTQLKLT